MPRKWLVEARMTRDGQVWVARRRLTVKEALRSDFVTVAREERFSTWWSAYTYARQMATLDRWNHA